MEYQSVCAVPAWSGEALHESVNRQNKIERTAPVPAPITAPIGPPMAKPIPAPVPTNAALRHIFSPMVILLHCAWSDAFSFSSLLFSSCKLINNPLDICKRFACSVYFASSSAVVASESCNCLVIFESRSVI